METVEKVTGAMGEADVDPGRGSRLSARRTPAHTAGRCRHRTQGDGTCRSQNARSIQHRQRQRAPKRPTRGPRCSKTGAALLQGLATARSASGAAAGEAPFAIERDPVTGQASVRLPLPEPAVLQRLAKALEPWLRR